MADRQIDNVLTDRICVLLCSLSVYFSQDLIMHDYYSNKVNELSMHSLTFPLMAPILENMSMLKPLQCRQFLVVKILLFCQTASFLQDNYASWMGASAGPTSFKEEKHDCCCCLQFVASSQDTLSPCSPLVQKNTVKPRPTRKKMCFVAAYKRESSQVTVNVDHVCTQKA